VLVIGCDKLETRRAHRHHACTTHDGTAADWRWTPATRHACTPSFRQVDILLDNLHICPDGTLDITEFVAVAERLRGAIMAKGESFYARSMQVHFALPQH
jgi:hypothetical protein